MCHPNCSAVKLTVFIITSGIQDQNICFAFAAFNLYSHIYEIKGCQFKHLVMRLEFIRKISYVRSCPVLHKYTVLKGSVDSQMKPHWLRNQLHVITVC